VLLALRQVAVIAVMVASLTSSCRALLGTWCRHRHKHTTRTNSLLHTRIQHQLTPTTAVQGCCMQKGSYKSTGRS